MKKAVFAAMLALAGLVIVGCAGNKAGSADANPVTAWQEDRIYADLIQEKNAAGTPVTLEDLKYKSESEIPAIASAVELIASFPTETYHKVVTEVDQLNAYSNGRNIYYKSENTKKAIAAEPDPAKKAEIQAQFDKAMKELTPEQKQALADYKKMISQVEQTKIIESTVVPMIEKLVAEGAKLAVAINQLKDDPAFKALGTIALGMETKNLAVDTKNITQIVDDAQEGAKLWKQLLEDDARFRNYKP